MTGDDRKIGQIVLRRFKRVMSLNISVYRLAQEMHAELGLGVDWRGCSKSILAEDIALGGDHGKVFEDVDGFIERLEKEFGIKQRRMW